MLNILCPCRPIGRVSTLRTCKVSVRIRPGVPSFKGWFQQTKLLQPKFCSPARWGQMSRVRVPERHNILFLFYGVGSVVVLHGCLWNTQWRVRFPLFTPSFGCLAQMRARKKPLNNAGLRGRRSSALQQPMIYVRVFRMVRWVIANHYYAGSTPVTHSSYIIELLVLSYLKEMDNGPRCCGTLS